MAITTKNRIITIVLTLLLFVTFLFGQGNLPVSYLVAQAATTDSFDDTNVLDDLMASAICFSSICDARSITLSASAMYSLKIRTAIIFNFHSGIIGESQEPSVDIP